MKKKSNSSVAFRPIELADLLSKRHTKVLALSLVVPFALIGLVIAALFIFQKSLYGEVAWYTDPFTLVMIFLFSFAQILAFKQFVEWYNKSVKMTKLLAQLSNERDINSLEDLKGVAERVRSVVPHSEIRSLVLNWLDFRGDSTAKRNDVLENNSYIRMDLVKEKTGYFHVLMNRVTLKLGFLGTLIGLMMTFPNMKRAIQALPESGGEMTFVNDICRAIDGDQFAILTTLVATVLSLIAEFITIQMINRFSVNEEIIMSYLTDWYHTRIEPLFAQGTADSMLRLEQQFSNAEELLAQNMQVLTQLSKKNADQLSSLAEFHATIDKRIAELESYEIHYRALVETKGAAEQHLAGNIQVLTDVAQKTGEQLKGLVSSQEVIGLRVENLHRYEEQYRSLITSKDSAGVPHDLRPNGGTN